MRRHERIGVRLTGIRGDARFTDHHQQRELRDRAGRGRDRSVTAGAAEQRRNTSFTDRPYLD
jgi:hypothetical protein